MTDHFVQFNLKDISVVREEVSLEMEGAELLDFANTVGELNFSGVSVEDAITMAFVTHLKNPRKNGRPHPIHHYAEAARRLLENRAIFEARYKEAARHSRPMGHRRRLSSRKRPALHLFQA